MKTTFSVYDPAVQQALQAQGSQYVVPQPPPPQQWPGAMGTPEPAPEQWAPGTTLESMQSQGQQAEPVDVDAQIAAQNAQAGMGDGSYVPPWMLNQSPAGAPVQVRIPPPDAGQQSAPQETEQQEPEQQPQPRQQSSVSRQPAKSGNRERMDAAFTGMGDAITQRQQTAEDLGQARAETGRSTADLLSESTVDSAMAQQELADAQDAHVAATSKVQQEQRELTQFISNYEPKDRRTTTSRVMGAIAVAMAGMQDQGNLVAGLRQGLNVQTNNAAMVNNMINTSIDRDIDLQRQMLDNKRTGLAAKNTELGQMRERYGDGVDSIKLARAMKIDQYQKELESIVARGGSQDAVLSAQDAKAQLEQQKQQLFFEVYGQRYQQEVAARAAAARANRPMTAKDALDLEGKALDNAGKRQALAAGPGDDKKTAEAAAARRTLIGSIEKLKQLRAEHPVAKGMPGWVPGTTVPEQLKSTWGDVKIQAKNAAALGALSESDMALITDQTGDPTSWGSGADASLDTMIENTRRAGGLTGTREERAAWELSQRTRPGLAR